MSFLKQHLLVIFILPLSFLLVAAAYYRFIVLQDYIVSYDVDCNPAIESCFYCSIDDCGEEYYYALIERPAPELIELCGTNVLDCDARLECPDNSTTCAVIYCNPVTNYDCSEAKEHILESALRSVFESESTANAAVINSSP